MNDKEKMNEIIREFREYLQKIRKESGNENEQPSKDIMQEYSDKIKEVNKSIRKKDEEIEFVINKIIEEYNDITKDDAIATFTEGGCYYFAYMLKQIFQDEANIYISMSEKDNHAIVEINGSFYDVNGNIDKMMDKHNEIRNRINIEEYSLADNEYFLYFSDLCNLGHSKEKIKDFEQRCDKIIEKVKNDLKQEKDKKVL